MPDPTNTDPVPTEPAFPPADDPGGAHAKGFTAERPATAAVPPAGPLPVADAPGGAAVTHPEYDGPLGPTGRSEPRPRTPNDRLMGADR